MASEITSIAIKKYEVLDISGPYVLQTNVKIKTETAEKLKLT
jgi:hypothetical protein